MALYRLAIHWADGQPDHPGKTGSFTVGPDMVEQRCHYCGGEAKMNQCPGDDRSHYHGEVHLPDSGLVAVCGTCIPKARAEWDKTRLAVRRMVSASA